MFFVILRCNLLPIKHNTQDDILYTIKVQNNLHKPVYVPQLTLIEQTQTEKRRAAVD